MYARGALPESVPRPSTGAARTLPAAMPATCVPCCDCSGSNGLRACCHFVVAGANARAAITFGVVKLRWPFGKPAG